ncbi:MAG: hypothetical protein J6I74_06195 [Schwartzia sp.]|nr:hypothetical protein [Schwartzia sp. (in: firmicutes)]
MMDKVNRLKNNMKPKQFENAMYGIFKETGRKTKTILKKDIPKDYHAKPREIGQAVKSPQLGFGGGGVSCSIPVTGHRGSIGGRYKASGGAKGWESLHKKYRITARVVKAGTTRLPKRMPGSYGGNPPFINTKAPKLNGVAFTRKTEERFPIMKVVGIGIPQMPRTRSEPHVQRDLKVFLENRMEHRFQALILHGR